MNFIKNLHSRWKKRLTKIYFPDVRFQVKYAFTCGGVDYFEMDDIFNLPYQRGLAAMSVYEELRMKCGYEFLKAHCEAVNNILSAPKFNLASALQLKKLNDQIRERLTWITDVDLAYKLAAVVYFDKNEKPQAYDAKYCFDKIQRWKKAEGAQDFFLRHPLQKLIPFLKDADLNMQIYSEVMQTMTGQHWENIFSSLSEEQKKQFSGSRSKLSAEATQPN